MQTQAPWTRHPWRWMIANASAWAVLALLFAVQGAAMRAGKLSLADHVLRALVSFAPCAILTPFIAYVAARFRFGGDRQWRSIAAHVAGLLIGA